MGCPIHLRLVLCSALKDLKTSYHICSCHAYKQGLFLLKSKVNETSERNPKRLISDSQSDVVHVHENHKRKSNPKELVNLKRKCSDERYEKRQKACFFYLA